MSIIQSYCSLNLRYPKKNENAQKQPFADVLQNKFLKNVTIFIGKHLCWSILNKNTQLYQKETPTLFSCEYCKISKNSFFDRALLVAVPEGYALQNLAHL